MISSRVIPLALRYAKACLPTISWGVTSSNDLNSLGNSIFSSCLGVSMIKCVLTIDLSSIKGIFTLNII